MNIQRIHVVWIALLSVSVAFAGCTSGAGTDGDPTASQTDSNQPIELGTKGAISGLVVDDNFRPVQLKEEWDNAPGDFQDIGFVLILETGQRFETNENGEFTVLPLDPGSYTIRVAADTHEAKDAVVQVVSGEYSEVTLEARRQYSGGGSILSQEQVLFISCTVASTGARLALAAVGDNGCGDLSGDSSRFDFFSDYSAIAPDIRGMVTEFRGSQQGYYGVTIRTFQTENCECEYADFELWNEKYDKNVLYPDKAMRREGRESTGEDTYSYLEEGQDGWRQPGSSDTEGSGFWAMSFDYDFQTAMFADHPSRYYTGQVLNPVACGFVIPDPYPLNQHFVDAVFCDAWGNGVVLGVKAQFLQNVFLYELPEEGIEEYCAICEDADIPE